MNFFLKIMNFKIIQSSKRDNFFNPKIKRERENFGNGPPALSHEFFYSNDIRPIYLDC